jgi:hypothetical protein
MTLCFMVLRAFTVEHTVEPHSFVSQLRGSMRVGPTELFKLLSSLCYFLQKVLAVILLSMFCVILLSWAYDFILWRRL